LLVAEQQGCDSGIIEARCPRPVILTGPAPSLNVDERSARAVTVGDVELGAAWRPLDHWVFSLGWMLQGWTNLNGFQQNLNLASNANILAVDGLSVRVEVNW